jgi:hypothetical protein
LFKAGIYLVISPNNAVLQAKACSRIPMRRRRFAGAEVFFVIERGFEAEELRGGGLTPPHRPHASTARWTAR